jgi:hypothetical protein
MIHIRLFLFQFLFQLRVTSGIKSSHLGFPRKGESVQIKGGNGPMKI